MWLRGEQLALEIERKRLLDLNLDSNEYTKWRSQKSDGYGYDFESVDYINNKLSKYMLKWTFRRIKKNNIEYLEFLILLRECPSII